MSSASFLSVGELTFSESVDEEEEESHGEDGRHGGSHQPEFDVGGRRSSAVPAIRIHGVKVATAMRMDVFRADPFATTVADLEESREES